MDWPSSHILSTPIVSRIAIVPFGLPGDVVDIRVFKSHPLYVESDLLAVKKAAAPERRQFNKLQVL